MKDKKDFVHWTGQYKVRLRISDDNLLTEIIVKPNVKIIKKFQFTRRQDAIAKRNKAMRRLHAFGYDLIIPKQTMIEDLNNTFDNTDFVELDWWHRS